MKKGRDDPRLRVLAAAKRYHEDHGVTVAEMIGSFELPLIELFLLIEGYLDSEPTLAKPRDN
jgi:hypothetical protein